MASVVEICNLALTHVRGGSINSLDEASVQAQRCKLFYETARDQALVEAGWGFTRTVKPLAKLLDASVFGWLHTWAYPVDCLKIDRVIRNIEAVSANGNDSNNRWFPGMRREEASAHTYPPVEYELHQVDGSRVIATMEDDLRIQYRKRITDPNLYPADFRMALSFLLAHYLAPSIAGDKEGRVLKAECFAQYQHFLARAADNTYNQHYRTPPESEFITCRG